MGKTQKKRLMRRHNPVRVPDSHLPKGLGPASASSSKNEAILPIIQKLENPDADERKWACVAVSNLIQNDPSTRRLLQGKNVVGALITRLTDSEEEVIIEAIGALRNLCIDGGYDICSEMYNKNILIPLKTFVTKIAHTLAQYLDSPKTAPEKTKRLVYEFADNVITTLWCLSETSNKALNAINQMALVDFLMSFLASRDQLPLTPVVAAAQCLYVLTDDNLPAIEEFRSYAAYTSCLLSIVRPSEGGQTINLQDESSVRLSVLACGILRNVSPLPLPSTGSVVNVDTDIVLPLLQPLICAISLTEISDAAQQLLSREASVPSIEKLSLNTPKTDFKTVLEIELEKLENRLRTVQLALEILTGLCATLPDPGPDAASHEDDAQNEHRDNEEDAADDDPDVEMIIDDPQSTNPPTSSPSFLPALVPSLLALIHPASLSFPPLASPSPHPPITSALGAIHVCALECLNNVFLSLGASPQTSASANEEAGRKIWDEIWQALRIMGTEFGLGQEKRREVWETAIGVLWGIGNIWKGTLIPQADQVQILIQFSDSAKDPQIRVKCIGTLECLAQHPGSIDANRVISNYLISILPTAAQPSLAGVEPVIQAASALIDIYSDEGMPYDINFVQGKYLDSLAESVDGVKRAVKAIDGRKEGGKTLRMRGEEVWENLVAFIQYRRELGH